MDQTSRASDLNARFLAETPLDPDQRARMAAIRKKAFDLARTIEDHLSPGAGRDRAIDAVDLALTLARAAMIRDDPPASCRARE